MPKPPPTSWARTRIRSGAIPVSAARLSRKAIMPWVLVQMSSIPSAPGDQRRLRFHRVADDAVAGQLEPGAMGGGGEGGLGGGLVAVFVVEAEIARRLVMDQRRARGEGGVGADHRLAVPVVDPDQLGRVLRLPRRRGDDEGHRLAHEPHPVRRQRRPSAGRPARCRRGRGRAAGIGGGDTRPPACRPRSAPAPRPAPPAPPPCRRRRYRHGPGPRAGTRRAAGPAGPNRRCSARRRSAAARPRAGRSTGISQG